jgi:3-hydroxyacyl-CoA dehydrogenase
VTGEQSKAQRYFFFAERRAARSPRQAAATPLHGTNRIAIIGTGAGAAFAAAGIPVTVVEPHQDYASIPDADLVIVLATSAAGLDVDQVALTSPRPERVVGMQFLGPRLVEVVPGERSSDSAIATAIDVSRRIGKVPVLVRASAGSVGTRMLAAWRRQADQLLVEGAPTEHIERVVYDFGLPGGLHAKPDVAAGPGGVQRREIADQEILERLLYSTINEGANILDEGLVARASDIDVIWVYGYGWPTYRGGPMYFADAQGLESIRDRLLVLQSRHGDSFKAAALLDRLVAQGRRFADLEI